MKPIFDKKRMVFWVPVPEDAIDEIPECLDTEVKDGMLCVSLPAVYEVCNRCQGQGTHWHPAFDNGITQEDRERDWDDDSWDELMNGAYDVQCSECKGERVTPIPAATTADTDVAQGFYDAYWEDEMAYRAEVAAERRMGC